MKKEFLTATAVASLAFAGSAFAQQEYAPEAAAPAAQQQIEVNDAQVKEFVQVHKEVAEISNSYQGQLQATNDPEQVAEISQKANQEMAAVVEASPLSIQEYNQYAMLLQQDKDFQQKYLEHAK